MKRSVKIALILAGVLILLGMILCISVAVAVGRSWDRLSTFVSGEDYQRKEYRLPADQFTDLLVEESDNDIRITVEEGDKISVSYVESNTESYEIELSPQGQLRIRKKTEHQPFYFSLGLWQEESTELRISIPQELAGNLDILSASGDVYITELNIKGSLSIASASGDMHLQNCKVQQKVDLSTASGDLWLLESKALAGLKAKTTSGCIYQQDNNEVLGDCHLSSTSGEIYLQNNAVSGLLSLESSSGDLQLKNLQLKGNLQIESTSGDIKLDTLQIEEDLQAKSTSGNIELAAVSAQDMYFQSTSGDISGTLLGDSADYSFNSRSTSGSIRLPSGNGSRYSLHVSTTSGDVYLQMQDW